MWFHTVIMWFQAFVDKHFPSQRDKIEARLLQIDGELEEQNRLIKDLRIRHDKLTWFKASFERLDEITESTVELINDELLYRKSRVSTLISEQASLNLRLGKLPVSGKRRIASQESAYI